MNFGLLLLAAAALATWSSTAEAKRPTRIQLDGTIGTRFGGSHSVDIEDERGADVGTGTLRTDSSAAWGLLAAYKIQSSGNVFLSYSRQETTFRLRTDTLSDGAWSGEEASGEGSLEYFQFGGNLEMPTQFLIPYLGASVGLTRVAALSGGEGDWTRFNVTLDGGVRLEIVPLLDLRILGRVPFTFPATELYCISGRGCAVISNGNPFVQGEVHAGLGLRF